MILLHCLFALSLLLCPVNYTLQIFNSYVNSNPLLGKVSPGGFVCKTTTKASTPTHINGVDQNISNMTQTKNNTVQTSSSESRTSISADQISDSESQTSEDIECSSMSLSVTPTPQNCNSLEVRIHFLHHKQVDIKVYITISRFHAILMLCHHIQMLTVPNSICVSFHLISLLTHSQQ